MKPSEHLDDEAKQSLARIIERWRQMHFGIPPGPDTFEWRGRKRSWTEPGG